MQMTIKTLIVSGFRGFVEERVLDLSKPVTILYGDNAQGKSSVLNAIEWCLFGNDCAGKDTGMRERVGWRPENRLGIVPCKVRMVCHHLGEDIIFERVPAAKNKGLTVSRGGRIISMDMLANSWVRENVGDFTQFMAMVYQHQENIRYLAIAEDSFKRKIINILLGLSDYTSFLDSLQPKGYSTFSRKVTGVRDSIDDTIQNRAFGYDDQNKRLAQDLGLKLHSISKKLISAEADSLSLAVQALYRKTGVNLAAKTSLDDYTDSREYLEQMRVIVRSLQSRSPESKENSELGKQISILDYHIGAIAESEGKKSSECKAVAKSEIKHGKLGDLEKDLKRLEEDRKHKEDEIARVSAIYSVLSGLNKYLTENELGTGKQVCLACGSTVNNQQNFLKKRLQELESDTVKAARKELEEICENIRLATGRLKELKDLHQRLEQADKAYTGDVRKAQTGLKLTLKSGEAPLKVLNKLRSGLEQRRNALQKALEGLLGEITKIEESCDRLYKIITVMENKARIQYLSSIKRHKAYKELEKLESDSALLSSDIEAIIMAVTSVRDKESKSRVAGAKTTVKDYFNMVAENPGIEDLEMILERTRGCENFRFRDATGDVMTILSQGDLNVLALSIFTGLGQANLKDIPLKSVVFDDPSQSMGSHHKEKLAELINSIAADRQVIVGTMDSEFKELLEKHITRPAELIEFTHWDPEDGPALKSNAI